MIAPETPWPRSMTLEVYAHQVVPFYPSHKYFHTGYLRSVGVTTPVSTADNWVNIRNNPELCEADFAGANAQYVTSMIIVEHKS
jgi:hypothetical protein